MMKDGDIFGVDGGKCMEDECVWVGNKKITAWNILRDHSGNLGTVERFREVEGVEYYERGVFPARFTMGNRAIDLNSFTDCFVPYKYFRSTTGYRNITFHYEKVVHELWCDLGLLDKTAMTSVSICFTLDISYIYKHSRCCHVLGGYILLTWTRSTLVLIGLCLTLRGGWVGKMWDAL